MRINDLTGDLRQPYTAARGYGIDKDDDPKFKNIHFVVPPPPPRSPPKDLPLRLLGQAHTVLARLPDYEAATATDRLVGHFFAQREAVQSSRMEGTWSTLDEVLTPADARDLPSPGVASVRGYVLTLTRHIDKANKLRERAFTAETVCEIHADIVSRDPAFRGKAGKFREIPAWIGGGRGRPEDSIYNPAPPKHIGASLAAVMAWLSDTELAERGDAGTSGFTIPVRLAIAHSHFEAVHPFSDGNGRVGRALWPLQMVAAGRLPLYLSGYVEAEKKEYAAVLQTAQKKLKYGPMVEFICSAIIESDREASTTTKVIETFKSRWRERAKFREKSTALRALDVLIHCPIVTADILKAELGVSHQAANTALHLLVERRILRQRGRIGRHLCYAAEELIALLTRDFGSDPEAAMAGALTDT